MDILPSRIAMPCPFAGGDGASYTEPSTVASEATMNWPKGFGSNYGAPASGGGKYVTRAEMNGLGRAATQDMFYHKCGGLNTFDPEFAEAVGGYPNGAVLDLLIDNKIFKVASLKPHNKYDFVANGVDGVNWIILNQDVASDSKVFGSFTHRATSAIAVEYIGTAVAPRGGFILPSKISSTSQGLLDSALYTIQGVPVGTWTSRGVVCESYVAAKVIGNVSDAEHISMPDLPDVISTTSATVSTKGWTCLFSTYGSATASTYDLYWTYGGGTISRSGRLTIGSQIKNAMIQVSEGDVIALYYVSGAAGISRVDGGNLSQSSAPMTATFQSRENEFSFDLTYLI